MDKKWERKFITYISALSVFGLLLSVYLLWQQFFQPAFQPCTVNASVNCDAIITGPVAKTWGIPTPLYGLIGYIVIFVAARLEKKLLLMGTATFGLIFCLWIGFVELFQLRVICPVCIGCQATMLLVFLLSLAIQEFIHKRREAK